MEVKSIVHEIGKLSLRKRYLVIEKTLKEIKKEEKLTQSLGISDLAINEKSLAKDWLSDEDNRWDSILG